MIRPPRIERQADGCPLLVDGFGQGHTPRALVTAIYSLEAQVAILQTHGYAALAADVQHGADQRRTWVRWMESGVER